MSVSVFEAISSPTEAGKPIFPLKRIKRKPPPVYDPLEVALDPELKKDSFVSPFGITPALHVAGTATGPGQTSNLSHSHDSTCDKIGLPSAKEHCRTKSDISPIRPSTEPGNREPSLRTHFQLLQLSGVGDLAALPPARVATFTRKPNRTQTTVPHPHSGLPNTIVTDSLIQKQPHIQLGSPQPRRRTRSLLSSLPSPLPVTPESSSEVLAPLTLPLDDPAKSSPPISALENSSDHSSPSADDFLDLPVTSVASVNTRTTDAVTAATVRQGTRKPTKLKRRARVPASSAVSEESNNAVDAYALPTREQLEMASQMTVISETGEHVNFGTLWQNQKTIVLFIRHFLCSNCQDYMYSVSSNLSSVLLRDAKMQLIVISNGAFEMIRSYRKIFRTNFAIYTDPTHQVYNALGMTLRSLKPGPRGDYIRHGILGGVAMVFINAVKVGMPIWKHGGEISQLGGEFVLGPGLNCSFAHRMRYVRDHLPILEVLARIGADTCILHDDSQKEQGNIDIDEEE